MASVSAFSKRGCYIYCSPCLSAGAEEVPGNVLRASDPPWCVVYLCCSDEFLRPGQVGSGRVVCSRLLVQLPSPLSRRALSVCCEPR